MDLNLSDEQRLLIESARNLVIRHWPISLVREQEENPAVASPESWKRIVEMDWCRMPFPEEIGGLGGGLTELALIVEELGRGAVSSPLITTVTLGGFALAWGSSESLRERWLESILAGDTIATLAHLDSDGRSSWPQEVVGAAVPDGWDISQTKTLVPHAAVSGLLLVTTVLDGPGQAIVAVPADSDGVLVSRHEALSGDPVYRVDLRHVRITPESVLATGDEAVRLAGRVMDTAMVVSCAHAVGLCDGALAVAVEHAKNRVQFGQPIGAFASVANRCADMRAEIEGARLVVRRAAWCSDRGTATSIHASEAKICTDSAVRLVTANAHQVLGAIGFSMEHDLQLYTRRAKAVEIGFGSQADHLDRVADELGL